MSAMPRPRGLLLTAWIMVFLNTAAWILQYWPRRPHHVHTSTVVFVALLMFTVRVFAFACIFYYAKGPELGSDSRTANIGRNATEFLGVQRKRFVYPSRGHRRVLGHPQHFLSLLA